MADAAEQALPVPAAAGKGSRGKLLVIAALAGLVLAGAAGGAAWWFGLLPGGGDDAAAAAVEAPAAADEHGGDEDGEGHAGPPSGVAFVDLPDVVVNLQSTGTRMRFLKLRISLEVDGDRAAEELRGLSPRLMDSFQLYLRSLTVEDVQGAAGMQRLKEEMLARVLRAVAPLVIDDLLIREMLVQ